MFAYFEKSVFFRRCGWRVANTQQVGDVSEMEWRNIGVLGNGKRAEMG